MPQLESILERTDAPTDGERVSLDVRELGPPEPLTKTLETLSDLPADAVVIQENDRVPQFLYPKLEDRGYRYETEELTDRVVTVIWTENR